MVDIAAWWDRFKAALPGNPNYDPYVGPQGTTLTSQPADSPPPQVLYKTASPLVNITDQDINRGMDLGMAFSGGGLATKPPPLIGSYHATGSPVEFSQFKLPPKEHDLGIHTTIDPNVADQYAYVKAPKGTIDKMTGKPFGDPQTELGVPGARIKPVLTDVQSAMRYPEDAGKWNDPVNVITPLQEAMIKGFKAPRGILEDMHNISGSEKMWQDQFAPMLKDRGIDALYYPHESPYNWNKYNTFMALDPKQVIPRFSDQGMALAAERGVKNPMQGTEGWQIPRNVMYKGDVENMASGTSDFMKGLLNKQSAEDAAIKANNIEYSKKMAILAPYHSQFKKGQISAKEYWDKHDELLFGTKGINAK